MTRRSRRRAQSLLVAILILGLPVTSAAHADPARPAALEAWQRSTSVPLSSDSSLSDVTALSATDVWTVGQQEIWDVWLNRGVIRHWTGGAWAEVPIRDTTGARHLRAIAAATPTDVWTVGDANDGSPYLGRGNAAGFDRVRVPGPEGLRQGDWLAGVEARPGRVIAVGSRDGHALIMTGQGAWSFHETKERGALYAVAGGFAVGDTGAEPLVMRLTGGAWKSMPLPEIPGGYLRDVWVDSSKRVLAVGGVHRSFGDVEPLVLSWNGKRWQRVDIPDTRARLSGVTGDGKGRYWISGYDPDQPGEAFLMRHDRRRTEIIRGGASSGRSSVRLQAVTYVPGKGAIWAVGHVVDETERYTDVIETFGPEGAVKS